jgi:anti-anti-sigma factor
VGSPERAIAGLPFISGLAHPRRIGDKFAVICVLTPSVLEMELVMTAASDDFRLEWHGNTVVITPAANVEQMPWDVIEQAAEIVMAPLKIQSSPMAVFDLSEVQYFGSAFLALLLRCHTAVKSRGGELVLSGPSKMARELLKLTALDTLWAIYATKAEALEAVDS